MRMTKFINNPKYLVPKSTGAATSSMRQVQVKVAWCGICGTDLREYECGPLYIPLEQPHSPTGMQAPVIIGHEMSGEVTLLAKTEESMGQHLPAGSLLRSKLLRHSVSPDCRDDAGKLSLANP